MEMSKREYAEAMAAQIEGAEVREVEKANGVVLTGISVKHGNVEPTMYVDKMYDDGYSIEKAAEVVRDVLNKSAKEIDVDYMTDYDKVKDKLFACLYNVKNADLYPVHVSAKDFGYDDLIITARVSVNLPDGKGSVVVSQSMINHWDVTTETVINDALSNSSYSIIGMSKLLAEMSGMIEMEVPEEYEMAFVVTNDDRLYGAVGVILAREELKRRFSNGYTVIPSSLHECIILPGTDDVNTITNMVGEVNATNVQPEDVLGDHAYVIKC
jgi:uncharacterized membrane protein